jgi:alpha-amylase
MNALADFIVRVEDQYPMEIENEELNALLTTIRNQEREIAELNKELASMRQNIEQYNVEHALREQKTAEAKPKASAKAKTAKAKDADGEKKKKSAKK